MQHEGGGGNSAQRADNEPRIRDRPAHSLEDLPAGTLLRHDG